MPDLPRIPTPREIGARAATAFWTVPAAITAVALALALAVARVDHAVGGSQGLLYAGDPDSARSILQVVASSVLTFAGLAFSITVVALQLASSQYSPRVLGSLLRDRFTQGALGVFVGTFAFALMTLREVRDADTSFVPGLGVTLTLLLALLSVGALVGFVQRMTQTLRVGTIIDHVFAEGRDAITRTYAEPATSARTPGRRVQGPTTTVLCDGDGVVVRLDHEALVDLAQDADVALELLVPVGSWVCADQPLARVHGAGSPDPEDVLRAVSLGRERDSGADPAYSLRLLVDMAERALSPGVNDPTTAIQCLDRLHSLLRRLVGADLDVGEVTDRQGVVRLTVPVPGFEDYRALACDEVRHWGAGSPRVHRRVRSMLLDLRELALGDGDGHPDRVEAIDHQLERLAVRRDGDVDLELAAGDARGAPGDPAEPPSTRAGEVP